MELQINESKSRHIDARRTPFNFLGFTIRYDRSIFDEQKHFWHIKPSEKANKLLRQNMKLLLQSIGHYPPEALVKELNWIVRGWLNYFEIQGISYTTIPKQKLNWYLRERLHRYFHRKSQRKTRLYRQQAFTILVNKYGLINPLTYRPATQLRKL